MCHLSQRFSYLPAQPAVNRVILERSNDRAAFNQRKECLLVKRLQRRDVDQFAFFTAGEELFIAVSRLFKHGPFKNDRKVIAAVGDGGNIADARNDRFIAHRHRFARYADVDRPVDVHRLLKCLRHLFSITWRQDSQARQNPGERQVFQGMMRSAIRSIIHAGVAADELNIGFGVAGLP